MIRERQERTSRWFLDSHVAAGAMALAVLTSRASAAVAFFPENFAGWQSATGSYSTCDFTGFAENTIITDQYVDIGVLFTGQSPNIVHEMPFSFQLDGWGLDPNGILELSFSQPILSVGGHGPGKWKYKLFLGDTLVGESFFYVGGPTDFAGVISDVAFDRAQLISAQPGGAVFMDNLYFSTIPTPGAGVVLAFAALGGRRRRM